MLCFCEIALAVSTCKQYACASKCVHVRVSIQNVSCHRNPSANLPAVRPWQAAKDVDAIELLGGGSRVPRLQAELSKALGGRPLDKCVFASRPPTLLWPRRCPHIACGCVNALFQPQHQHDHNNTRASRGYFALAERQASSCGRRHTNLTALYILTDCNVSDCRHLDAEEAVVLGAGLYAANLSTTFKLRKFRMSDGATYPVVFQVRASVPAIHV